jgi:hypothetical protein
MQDAKIYALLGVGLLVAMLFDSLADHLVVKHGWMWLRHGGALGEIQKQEREEYLASVWRYRD